MMLKGTVTRDFDLAKTGIIGKILMSMFYKKGFEMFNGLFYTFYLIFFKFFKTFLKFLKVLA